MAMRSRRKGKVGERELARHLSERGFPARRGQQHRGGEHSADVVSDRLVGVHLECKRCERLNLYDALDQARRDAGEFDMPVVAHRRNGREWVAILPLDELLTLLGREDGDEEAE